MTLEATNKLHVQITPRVIKPTTSQDKQYNSLTDINVCSQINYANLEAQHHSANKGQTITRPLDA